MDDYLQRILRARVYDVAIESPLDPAPNLSLRLGKHGAAQAGGPPAGLFVQAARRLQPHGPPLCQ